MTNNMGLAILGAGALSAGAGVLGSSKAAKAQFQATQAASDSTLQATREGIAAQREMFDLSRADMAPWRQMGQRALATLGGDSGFTPVSVPRGSTPAGSMPGQPNSVIGQPNSVSATGIPPVSGGIPAASGGAGGFGSATLGGLTTLAGAGATAAGIGLPASSLGGLGAVVNGALALSPLSLAAPIAGPLIGKLLGQDSTKPARYMTDPNSPAYSTQVGQDLPYTANIDGLTAGDVELVSAIDNYFAIRDPADAMIELRQTGGIPIPASMQPYVGGISTIPLAQVGPILEEGRRRGLNFYEDAVRNFLGPGRGDGVKLGAGSDPLSYLRRTFPETFSQQQTAPTPMQIATGTAPAMANVAGMTPKVSYAPQTTETQPGNMGAAPLTGEYYQADTFQPGEEFSQPLAVSESELRADPSYQFRLSEGLKALQNQMGSMGMRASGQNMKAITDYGQGLASTEYGNVYARKAGDRATRYAVALDRYNARAADRGARFNRLAGLAGMGQAADSQIAGQAAQVGSNLANLYGQQGSSLANLAVAGGQARAAGIGGIANAVGGGVNSGLNNYLAFQQLQNQNAQMNRFYDMMGQNLSGSKITATL